MNALGNFQYNISICRRKFPAKIFCYNFPAAVLLALPVVFQHCIGALTLLYVQAHTYFFDAPGLESQQLLHTDYISAYRHETAMANQQGIVEQSGTRIRFEYHIELHCTQGRN
jgi:hypothetical protein